MSLTNTSTSYGRVTKTFHWLTAALILAAIPAGFYAQSLPYDDGAALAQKASAFSVHKTIGVAAFFVALGRILWALTQTKPGLLNGDDKLESFAAELVHWLLYASMLIVPLSGWLHHSATTGFAPILWPFGQSLPFVPQSEPLAELFSAVHWVFIVILIGSLLAHIGGAMKHLVIDRDETVQRMWFGKPVSATPPTAKHSRLPLFAALIVALIGAGVSFTLLEPSHTQASAAPAPQVQATSGWQVEDGSIQISVQQMGQGVTGSFANWQAAITYDADIATGKRGEASVTIDVTSLTLGSVTSQALGADFFNSGAFPTAQFTADLMGTESGPQAEGTLTIRDQFVPITMPFDLTIDGDTATVKAQLVLDRRDFGMGANYEDESTVGFSVTVDIDLTATLVSDGAS